MSTNVNKAKSKSSGPKQPILPAAAYPGRVVQVIDFGLQPQSYAGEAKDPAYEVGLGYELSDEFCVDDKGVVQEDKPRWVSESFAVHNLKADKAKSTQRYLTLDPNQKHGGEFLDLVGTPCLINIIVNPGKGKNVGKTFNNVASISAMRDKEAAKLPPLVNDPITFSLDNPDLEVFNDLPDFIKDKIKGNLEFNGSKLQALLGGKPVDTATGEDNSVEEDDVEKKEW